MRITGIHRPSLVISESMGVGQLGRALVENEPNAKKVPFNANDVGFQAEFPRARVMRVALTTDAGGLGTFVHSRTPTPIDRQPELRMSASSLCGSSTKTITPR
jgi:hypothetical protein